MSSIPAQRLLDIFTRVDELLVSILNELKEIRKALAGKEVVLPEALIEKIFEILDWNMPKKDSIPAWIAETITVPASSELTITWRTEADAITKIKKLYCDPDVNCTYKWIIAGEEINGNEIEQYQPFILKRYSTITLIVANSGTSDVDLDVLVVGWAEKR